METDPLSPKSDAITRRPKDTALTQLRLKSKRPVPTPLSAIVIFGAIGSLFVLLGVILLIYSRQIIEVSKRYDDVSSCANTQWNSQQVCDVEIEVTEEMDGPVYFYYALTSFYQNQRIYVRSTSKAQLQGSDLSKSAISACEPVVDMSDLGRLPQDLSGGLSLSPTAVANPCGLIAKSFFNDTFAVYSPNKTQVPMRETGIAWQDDIDRGFKYMQSDWRVDQWTDVENEHFIVWMRISGLPNFRKLWGIIDSALEVGTYTLRVNSTFPTKDWAGTKSIVMSTTNGLGGDNTVLATIYLAFGGLAYCLALVFCIAKCSKKKGASVKYQE